MQRSIKKRKAPSRSGEENLLEELDLPDDATNMTQEIKPASRLKFIYRHFSVTKYIILLLFIPPFLNYAALKREASLLMPRGEHVDMGWGQKMFISCEGEGLPTVILDAPTGMSSDVWVLVQQHLAKVTKVCIYDRSGIGFSDPPFYSVAVDADENKKRNYVGQPATLEQMADDLHHLLTVAKPLPRPFILVGSELGALIARFYAQMYEKDISNIVLVDPLVEVLLSQDHGVWNDFWYYHLVPSFQSLHLASVLGLARIALLIGWMQPPIDGDLVNNEIILRQKYLLCSPSHMNSIFNEHLFINTSFSQMRTAWQMKQFPQTIPVTVISGKHYDEQLPSPLNEAWHKSQQYLMEHLHQGCKHLIVNGADHHMLYRQPEAVVNPIKNLVSDWRNNNIFPT